MSGFVYRQALTIRFVSRYLENTYTNRFVAYKEYTTGLMGNHRFNPEIFPKPTPEKQP